MPQILGLRFDAPAGFEEEECLLSLRAPAQPQLHDPRVLQKQLAVRPNLIAQRKRARPGASLAVLAGEISAELAKSVPGMVNLSATEMVFRDQAAGVLLSYEFPAGEGTTLRQLHALRLDGDFLTHFTLTADLRQAAGQGLDAYLASLASAQPV